LVSENSRNISLITDADAIVNIKILLITDADAIVAIGVTVSA